MTGKITLAAAVLLLCPTLWAQKDSARTRELNPIVVTGTGTHHKADNSPVAVKVISAKDLRNVQATSIQEALAKLTSNITLHTNGMGSFVNFNGISDDYMVILENGRRMSGDDRWMRISLDNVKRIEIYSGAASALYGSDAIAGVINIITAEAQQPVEASSRTKLRDKGRMDEDLNVNMSVGKFSSTTSYSHHQADNWQVNLYQEFTETDAEGQEHQVLKLNGRPMSQGFASHNISQKVEWKFDNRWSAYATGNYYDYLTHRPQNAQSYTQSQKTDALTGQPSYTYKAKAAYTYDLHHNTFKYGAGARFTPNRRVHLYLDLYSDNFTSKYDYWQTAEKEAYNERRKRTRYTNETLKGIFRLADWNNLSGGLEFVQESLNSESDHIDFETTHTYNLFAQDEVRIVRGLEALCGVRYTYNTHFGSHFTPTVGLFGHLGGFRLRANYAGGYRTPSLSQLYATDQAKTSGRYTINNTLLKAETSHSWNVNAEYGNRWMNLNVSGFWNRIRDMINYRTLTQQEIDNDAHLTQLAKDWKTIRQRDNIDRATLRGVSASLKFLFPFGLTVGGSYTFTDADAQTRTLDKKTQKYTVTHTAVDKSVRHVGNANVYYDHTWKNYHLNVALSGHIQGERFSSTYGYAKGYSQWDLNTRHAFTLRQFVLEPGIGIENLFNQVDNAYWCSNFSTTNPGRSFVATLALRFK